MDIEIKTPDYIEAMRDKTFYPHPVDEDVTLLETHISWVFLTGPVVYKLKKPVSLPFLDFTTLAARETDCRREIELNRRLTTGVYIDVATITAHENGFELDGRGRVVEYAVRMRQLAPEDSLENRLAEGTADALLLDRLALRLSRFYQSAQGGSDVAAFGTIDMIRKNCEENFTALKDAFTDKIDQRRLQIVRAATKTYLETNARQFRSRIRDNKIRDGHGDLRTDHVYVTGKDIQIIDCIEFNDRFRCNDVANDVAFLAMEMDFKGYPRLSGIFVSAFMKHSDDRQLPALMAFYKCYRAMVRVKVNALRMQQGNVEPEQKAQLREGLDRYLSLAYRYAVEFSRPVMWVVFGMVATGKSTVTDALAESLGISVIRSDAVRKQLFDKSSRAENPPAFERGMYTPAATAQTYGRMFLRAQEEMMEKHRSVVLDATFSLAEQRREALRLAGETDALIVFVECACSETTMRKRLAAREDEGGLSDARVTHLEELKARYQEPRELTAQCRIRIDTDDCLEENVQQVLMFTATPRDCLARDWMP